MVDKIVYTYKFTTLPNVDALKDECKVWLTTILDKYDPNKGSKAFSYFSVITKNWFIHKVKVNSKNLRRNVSYEAIVSTGGQDSLGAASDIEEYVEKRIQQEFWRDLLGQIESWNSVNLKPNEK